MAVGVASSLGRAALGAGGDGEPGHTVTVTVGQVECGLDGGEGGLESSRVEALAVTVSADTETDRVWARLRRGWRKSSCVEEVAVTVVSSRTEWRCWSDSERGYGDRSSVGLMAARVVSSQAMWRR
eukprot:453450-Rhodomonas_salina.1